jgi:hypothetical protein
MARRDMPGSQGRRAGMSTDPEVMVDTVLDLFDEVQAEMRWQAAGTLESGIVDVSTYMELQVRQSQLVFTT